jgi:acetoacetate decarboxylase
MYLDDDPPIASGREIWGFPKKYAHPKLEIVKDTLTGTLEYANQLVAVGTMGYKHEAMAGNGEATLATLSKTQINLKLIPGVDGRAEVCQLVAINLTDINVKGSWFGPGRLHLVPHGLRRGRPSGWEIRQYLIDRSHCGVRSMFSSQRDQGLA